MRSSFRKSSGPGVSSSVVSGDPHCRKKHGGGRRKSPRKTRVPSIEEQSPVSDQRDEVLTKVGLDQGQGLDTESGDISTEDGAGGWQVTEKEEEEAEEVGGNRDLMETGAKIYVEEDRRWPWVEKRGGGVALAASALLQLESVGSASKASDETSGERKKKKTFETTTECDTLSPAPFRRPR